MEKIQVLFCFSLFTRIPNEERRSGCVRLKATYVLRGKSSQIFYKVIGFEKCYLLTFWCVHFLNKRQKNKRQMWNWWKDLDFEGETFSLRKKNYLFVFFCVNFASLIIYRGLFKQTFSFWFCYFLKKGSSDLWHKIPLKTKAIFKEILDIIKIKSWFDDEARQRHYNRCQLTICPFWKKSKQTRFVRATLTAGFSTSSLSDDKCSNLGALPGSQKLLQ